MSFSRENFPAGFRIDCAALKAFMERRAPGRDRFSTSRREADEVEWLSGVDADGVTDGVTIRGTIRNTNARPGDYGAGRTVPRPGHADFGQWIQFGHIPTGGGKNSGRLTAPICAAGGVCLQWLEKRGISVSAKIDSIGGKAAGFAKTIDAAREAGDSVGGTIRCVVSGIPAGLGGELFDGFESALSAAMFAIPGAKGVEFGSGFACAAMKGSQFNDAFAVRDGEVRSVTNRQGGILGGRTDGMPVEFRVALRPTPTIFRPQKSVDLSSMKPAVCEMKGRHDPCIARRAVPVVEALAAFVAADMMLADEARHPRICLTLTGKTLDEDFAQFDSQRYFTDMVELRLDLLKPGERAKAKVDRFLARFPAGMPVILTKDIDHTVFADGRKINPVHDFKKPVANLSAKLRKLSANGSAVAKVAFMPRSLADVSRAFADASRGDVPPHVVIAMGAAGLATRVLAVRMGSLWTYCSVGGLESIGHVSPEELVRTYRFRSISKNAALYGVTGWPLLKTRSPEIHNAAFANEDEDAVMIPFPSKTAKEALDFMKAMGMKGMAVTIPHKQSIMPLLDRLDPAARKIGAVNTVALENGKYVGYNTDVSGFSEALVAFAGDVKGRRVAVLGDGGAAQAVKAALRGLGAKFAVFHRATPPQGFEILVNATPVDPIPDYEFTGRECVYDLRYVPETTPLMARAAAAGCKVENGFSMLQAQARGQRRIWGV